MGDEMGDKMGAIVIVKKKTYLLLYLFIYYRTELPFVLKLTMICK